MSKSNRAHARAAAKVRRKARIQARLDQQRPEAPKTKAKFQPIFDEVFDDPNVYQYRSPYNPKLYKCTGYGEEEYEYFDGSPGWPGQKDERFTIDLEGGSMDRLRDVRPYLYRIGFWSVETSYQPDIEKAATPSEVEEGYVKAGREYLIEERAKGRGFYLANRDWRELNRGFPSWPFFQLVGADPEEGDVGCQESHEWSDYWEDTCGVIKTNIRTPLPKQETVRCKPEDPDWDLFIGWIYDATLHGIMSMVNYHANILDVIRERRIQGEHYMKWLKEEV